MSTLKTANPQYIYEYNEDSQGELTNQLTMNSDLIKPIKMGEEEHYWSKRQRVIEEFIDCQKDSDLRKSEKEDVSIKKQLFGIGGQYDHMGISLDAKYSGDILYQLGTDNMAPLIPANTDVVLRFCHDFILGEVCVYRYNGENYCHQILKENGKLIAKSLNPKYKPVVLDPQKFFFIGVIYSVHYILKGR